MACGSAGEMRGAWQRVHGFAGLALTPIRPGEIIQGATDRDMNSARRAPQRAWLWARARVDRGARCLATGDEHVPGALGSL